MTQLIPGIALSGTRLIGMELDFTGIDERGRVWIPLDAGTHLLYGKNGVGKSTILRALRAALTADESEETLGFGVRLFVAIDDPRRPIHIKDNAEGLDSTDSSDDSLALDEVDDLGLLNLEEQLGHEASDYTLLTDALFQGEWWRDEGAALQKSDKLLNVQKTFLDDELRFEPAAIEWQPVGTIPLPQIRALWLAYFRIEADFFWDGFPDRDITGEEIQVRCGAEELTKFLREAATQSYYCLRPQGGGKWACGIAVKIESDNTSRLLELVRICLEDERAIFHQTELGWTEAQIATDLVDQRFIDHAQDSEFYHNVGPLPALLDWQKSGWFSRYPKDYDCPFLYLSDWREQPAVSVESIFPNIFGTKKSFCYLSLDSTFDLDDWNRRRVADSFSPYSKHNWQVNISRTITEYITLFADNSTNVLASNNKTTTDSVGLDNHQLLLDEIVTSIADLSIGIDALQPVLSNDLGDWLSGSACQLHARDSNTKTWFPISGLSPAQKGILSIAAQLVHAKSIGNFVIATGDEIDSGLHATAVKKLYTYLEKSLDCAYLTSHSPLALSVPHIPRLHVQRGETGNISVKRWIPSSDFGAAAAVLGVEKVHLLSAITCWVVVEGEHDKVAMEVLLSSNLTLSSSVGLANVVACRGHQDTAAVLNADLLLTFSDAPIVVVLDAAGKDLDFAALHEKARLLEIEGLKPEQIIRQLGLENMKGRLRPETRTLLAILNGSIRKRVVSRIHTTALRRPDIIQYLPTSAFGLEGTWDSLYTEYKTSSNQGSFKDWLRSTKGAQISVRSIRAGFEDLKTIAEDLSAVVSLIVNTTEFED